MCLRKTIVLKFGGSVLRTKDDLFVVVQEIYRWYRRNYNVVAVVSAFHGKTDQLFGVAAEFSDGSPFTIAKLVGGAEQESSALLGLSLDQCGLPNRVLSESESQLETCGDPLDATPQRINVDVILEELNKTGVVVIPGFVGRDRKNRINLLGRGGSDLTALFVAKCLKADRCRLIKDVNGLYEFDPKSTQSSPRRYLSLPWDDALELDESILQPKAIRYAKQNDLEFEVAGVLGLKQTLVGRSDLLFEDGKTERSVRVGLLGLGSVGSGVFDQLQRLGQRFQVTGVAVSQLDKHVSDSRFPVGGNQPILTCNWHDVVNQDLDVVVELIGGTEVASEAVENALRDGKYVVTANKSLLAIRSGMKHETELPNQLYGSAAVGGNVPMLELIRDISKSRQIHRITGILNGTTNFVLDQISKGENVDQAIKAAQQNGFAESDPSRDLDGIDAAEKLVLLAKAAGIELSLQDVEIEPWNPKTINKVQRNGCTFRQVASLNFDSNRLDPTRLSARVEYCQVVQSLEPGSYDQALLDTKRQHNLLIAETTDGDRFELRGLGAGRWPTTIAVVADLIDLAHELERSESEIPMPSVRLRPRPELQLHVQ